MSRSHGKAGDVLAAQIAATVRWIADRRSVPRDIAEDAVQDALVQYLRLPANLLPENLGSWLTHVAEKRLLDTERHRATQPPPIGDIDRGFASTARNIDETIDVLAALRRLDPALEAIVLGRAVVELSWREVAAQSGLSEEAVRKRYERGLIQLRALLHGV